MLKDYRTPKGIVLTLIAGIILLGTTSSFGQTIPQPYEVYGNISVDGILITGKNASYTVKITKANGTEYIDSNNQAWSQKTTGGVANNAVGALVGYSGYYAYRIPMKDAAGTAQPSGAVIGDTVYIHAYKDGTPVTITSPNPITLAVGASGDSVQISITATTPRPEISVSPGSLPFGSVSVGEQSDLAVNIKNVGNIDLSVSSLDVGSGSYSLVDPPGLPVSLPPDASANVTVRFMPLTKGSLPGTLTIGSNDPAHASISVPLTGTGVAQLCLKGGSGGWNLVALPVIPTSTLIGSILADIVSKVQIVWGYSTDDGWHKYQPGKPSDLTELRLGHGYWIKVTEDVCLTIP
jgi:hypothetical protein